MKIRENSVFTLLLCQLATFVLLIACTTSDEGGRILNMRIDDDNDSLLTFDSLIVTVYSEDSSFSQEVFHGKLRDPKQVLGMPLDPRVGKRYTVFIVGYRNGKVGVNLAVTILSPGNFESKDLGLPSDSIKIVGPIPEILVPADTSVAEGDSLRLPIHIRNHWSSGASLTVKNPPGGSVLDTTGLRSGFSLLTWTPNFSQGRIEPYVLIFVYTLSNQKVEKTVALNVRNTNQPPSIKAIADQKVKENEILSFRVEAIDLDQDSLILTSSALPDGGTFSSGIFSWKPRLGQEGNYSIKFMAWDGVDSGWAAVLVTVGNAEIPPALVVEIVSPSRDTAVNISPIDIFYKVNDVFLQKKIYLSVGRKKVSIDTTVLGRTALDTIIITYDTIPPLGPILKGVTPTKSRIPVWHWKGGGEGAGIFRYRLDNQSLDTAPQTLDTSFAPATGLDTGSYTLFLQERDEAGNWSATVKFTIRIDVTPPNQPLADPNFNPLVNTSKPMWSWLSGGGGGMGLYRVMIDNSDFANGGTEVMKAEFQSMEPLKEGSHFLNIQEMDSAGNWSATTSMQILIDLTPPSAPTIASLPNSPLNDIRPNWNWVPGGGGAGQFRCKLDDQNLSTGTDTIAGTNFMPTNALSEGPHTLYVQEMDSAGNWSIAASRTIVVSLREVVGAAGISSGSAYYLSMAISSANVPHIAFVDSVDSLKATVMQFKGGIWRKIGGAASGANASNLSFAISQNGDPYITNETNDGRHGPVMKFVGGSWTMVGAEGVSPDIVYYPSIAFGKAGVPYVAFTDWNDYKIAVAYYNDTSWVRMPNSGLPSVRSHEGSLVFGNDGTPYVVFLDTDNEYRIVAMRFNGTSWDRLGGGWVSGVGASKPSLAIGPKGVPYVAFSDEASGGKARVVRYSGTTWEAVGKQHITNGTAETISIGVNPEGETFLAFKNIANEGKAMVTHCRADKWDTVGVAGLSSGEVNNLSLALSGTGVPYIAFSEAANGGRVTVMKLSFDP